MFAKLAVIAAAATLNAQLPRALHMDIILTTSAISIRHAVEAFFMLRDSLPLPMLKPVISGEKSSYTPCSFDQCTHEPALGATCPLAKGSSRCTGNRVARRASRDV